MTDIFAPHGGSMVDDDLTLDDYWPPADPFVEREPRKCRRHDWYATFAQGESPRAWLLDQELRVLTCRRCGAVRDETRARRGKTSRNRGNAYEREVAAKLGGRRVGQYGDSVDVEVPGWLRVQCKNGGSYPALLDRWLRAIPVQADLLRAVVVGDAPGPGTRRRSLIVLDLDEFTAWYGRASR